MSLVRSNIGTVYGTTTKTNSKSQKNLVKYNGSVFEQLEFDLNEIEDNLAEINLGMTIAGYCPCHVEAVVEGGLAFRAGLRPGDLIMRINEVSCCRARLKSVLVLIKRSHAIKIGVYRPLKQQQHRQEPIKAQVVKKSGRQSSLKSKLLSKLLLKPSMWLSCAQPNNQTLHHQSTFYFPASSSTSPIYASLIETAAGNVQSCNVERSHDEIVIGKASSTAVAASSSASHATATSSDTGYESINNRFDGIMDFIPAASTLFQMPMEDDSQNANDEDDEDFEVTMTVNSYSGLAADVTTNSTHHEINPQKQINPTNSTSTLAKNEKFNEMRTRLIGELIEMEANFVSYLTMSVATFSRPLRGFFIKQSDYFCLFQNIEKLLVISENFLRSMDKWSAYDLYTKIGQLYSHKMSLFKEAYTLYARGHHAAKSLLSELREHSKQFRLFLSEVESSELTLQRALDLPIVHVKRTLEIFKQIRAFTLESRRNPTEAPHIDSVIFELRAVLANLQTSSNIEAVNKKAIFDDDDTMTTSIEFTLSSIEEECDQDDEDTTVDDLTIVRRRRQRRGRRSSSPHINSCCSSSSSSSSSSLSRDGDNEDKNTFFLSPINRF